jgi:O-antigen ligase
MNAPRWLVALPLVWLAWQFVSATHTVNATLTRATLSHFVSCVACFYCGFFALGRRARMGVFFAGPMIGLVIVILAGIDQRFGGLEETRRYFFAYLYPQNPHVPPEFLKKISSNRIFSTLFYPNALAGVLLLWLPATLAVIWNKATRLTPGARGFLVVLVSAGGLACLYWSGSKGGWLLMLFLGLMALLQLPFASRWKLALVGLVLVCGLVGFGLKYAGFFRKGATSVSARFDYWRAAAQTAAANPVFGTGPGTFAIPYQQIKRPESEMAKLTHNDYLQQASDSGLIGFATYATFMAWGLIRSRPRFVRQNELVQFAVWLGLLGWALQGCLEFGLYIPALSWSGFAMMGWLLAAAGKPFDKSSPVAYAAGH